MSAGVGGAVGLELRDVDEGAAVCKAVPAEVEASGFGREGVNGSLVMSGKDGS